MTYSLSITLTNDDLNQIYAQGKSITLIKSVESASNESPVVWTSFRPLTSNQVNWTPSYQAYAAQKCQMMNGAMISPMSQASVGLGQCIPYSGKGFGTPETDAAPATSMSIANIADGQILTMGLTQTCTVNGMTQSSSPLCALTLSSDMTATFTPIESVNIFLYSYANAGMVMMQMPSNSCVVSYTADTYARTVRYNSSTGSFECVS